MGEDKMNFMKHPQAEAKACRAPCCSHNDEYSAAIANRSSRRDILDQVNGNCGPIDIGEGPSNGAAPGAGGIPTTGSDATGIPDGLV
jgi:hypothetical protein